MSCRVARYSRDDQSRPLKLAVDTYCTATRMEYLTVCNMVVAKMKRIRGAMFVQGGLLGKELTVGSSAAIAYCTNGPVD